MKNYIFSRPVNALKKQYAPSYLGAKIRAAKANPTFLRITELAIQKRLNSSEEWAYKSFMTFKRMNEQGGPEYREHFAPSPLTSTAEAFILNELGEELSAHRSSRVYSYISSKKGSTHNYNYYLEFYQKRNFDILKSLEKNTDMVVLFLDIRNFYVSVNRDYAKETLRKHPIWGNARNTFALDFAIKQINIAKSGIPIGPELSHALADACLESLDTKLENMLGDNYFRYVDDLTIVCKPSEVDRHLKLIQTHLYSIDLQLNDKKKEVFSLKQWQKEMDTSPFEGDDFFAYCQKLSGWIDKDSAKIGWFDQALRDEGFQLPLKKITFSTGNKNSTQTQHSEKTLVDDLKNLRKKYLNAINEVSEKLSNTSTRWYLQKTKRTLNPLFYLLDRNEYNTIAHTARESSALKPQEEVSLAIYKNNCNEIIKYPGLTINSFCEIWKTAIQNKNKLSISKEDLGTEIEIESAITLALFDITNPHKDINNTSMWKALKPDITAISDKLPAFEAEIESVRIGVDKNHTAMFLENRFSSEEEVYLTALELGSSISP